MTTTPTFTAPARARAVAWKLATSTFLDPAVTSPDYVERYGGGEP